MARISKEQRIEDSIPWRTENIELLSWLFSQDDSKDFIRDMKVAVQEWGKLTYRQQSAVESFRRRSQEHKAQEGTPKLDNGRYEMTGEIVAVKYHDGNYGTTLKMTVKLDSGNRCWGTVPGNLDFSDEQELVGKRISFIATITPKDDHFGFFSRPTAARFVG